MTISNGSLLAVLQDPTKEGFEFVSWYTDEELSNEFNFSNTIETDLILYAKWIEGSNELTFDLPNNSEIELFVYGGSGTYYQDLGKLDISDIDLYSRVDAAYYAVAKEFNLLYPDVVINMMSSVSHPSASNYELLPVMNEHKNMFGRHPSLYITNNTVESVTAGIVADLSVFSGDPKYQSINQNLMSMLNYNGVQAAIPYGVVAKGVYINKGLITEKGFTVPNVNWTLDEFTALVSNSVQGEYYGTTLTPYDFLITGTSSISKELYSNNSNQISYTNDEVENIASNFLYWTNNSIYGTNMDQDLLMDMGHTSFRFFAKGYAFTNHTDSWALEFCGDPSASDYLKCEITDWDYYPRPSTDYVGNTIGIDLEPLVVYNQCLNDGDLACSDEEMKEIYLNYLFAMFIAQDTTALQARIDQTYNTATSNGNSSNGLMLPITTGDLFNEQMDIWYMAREHQAFEDEIEFPGFHEVINLYESGTFWDIPVAAYPLIYQSNGQSKILFTDIFESWNHQDTNSETYSNTGMINMAIKETETNQRLEEMYNALESALATYYGK